MNIIQKYIAIGILIIICIPAISMKFTKEVNWSLNDFFLFGILLTVFGYGMEYIYRKIKSRYKIVFLITILILFFLLWAEMAVGLINSPIAGS